MPRSPLLHLSLLFSFPPVTQMFQFTGFFSFMVSLFGSSGFFFSHPDLSFLLRPSLEPQVSLDSPLLLYHLFYPLLLPSSSLTLDSWPPFPFPPCRLLRITRLELVPSAWKANTQPLKLYASYPLSSVCFPLPFLFFFFLPSFFQLSVFTFYFASFQPQILLRLPCYDFHAITFFRLLSRGDGQLVRIEFPFSPQLSSLRLLLNPS